jgi:succinoglycan biosynthesis protein ExoA
MIKDEISSVRAPGSLPLVSVVLPVRNEAAFIVRSLGAVLGQDYPHELMEVLLVDGMSSDGTREKAMGAAARVPSIAFRILDNPRRIAPTALNVGVLEARGDVVVRVDGHCEVAPDYVSRCIETLAATGAAGVGGPIETVGETSVARAIAAAMSSRFGVGDSGFRTGTSVRRETDTVAFPAYPRVVLDKSGPFDEELVRNQDDEYNYRLRERGGRIVLDPAIRSRYWSRASLRSLWRQYLQYGYWKVRVMQKHPRQMRPRQLVPALFVGTLLALGVAAPVWHPATWALAVVGAGYLAATLTASFFVAAGSGWSQLVLLPAVFAALHFGYGLGFLGGLVRFMGRWGGRAETEPRTAQGEKVA